VIPDTAEALIDIRTLPGEEDAVLAEVRAMLPDEVEIEVVTRDVGLENPFSGALVEAMVATLVRHDPEAQVIPYLLSGGTDNKALSELGITGYGFAPLQLTPSSTSRRCSTGSTSACRSRPSTSAIVPSPICSPATEIAAQENPAP